MAMLKRGAMSLKQDQRDWQDIKAEDQTPQPQETNEEKDEK